MLRFIRTRFVPVVSGVVIAVAALPASVRAETGPLKTGGFTVEHTLTLPGAPEAIYDAISGDISPWWDHTFSGDPARFYIEAKPGGGFMEIMKGGRGGVRHATVIYADRGKALRFEGPLGLSGYAIQMVHTYTFEAVGPDSTRLSLSVHAAGEIQDGWAEAVDRTWHHFLFDRFKPYVESGRAGGRDARR